ncbi:unnamed protein product [Alternaria alternata]
MFGISKFMIQDSQLQMLGSGIMSEMWLLVFFLQLCAGIKLPISSSVDDMSSVIVEKSPSLESIHLWFSAQGNELSPHVFTVPRGEPSSRGILFSMATRLTILGYDFKHLPKLANFASHKKLLSLTLRCTIDFLPNEEETSLPLGIGHFEALIRDTLLSYITEMGSTIDDSILEYLGVVVNVTAYTLDLPAKAPEGPNQALERLKKVLCLRPKQVLRLADLAMEEMMARYAKDDYYFLEAYIDTMTKASRVGISSGSKFVAYN